MPVPCGQPPAPEILHIREVCTQNQTQDTTHQHPPNPRCPSVCSSATSPAEPSAVAVRTAAASPTLAVCIGLYIHMYMFTPDFTPRCGRHPIFADLDCTIQMAVSWAQLATPNPALWDVGRKIFLSFLVLSVSLPRC